MYFRVDMAVHLSAGSLEDVSEVAKLNIVALANDDQWTPLMQNAKPDDHYSWLLEIFMLRISRPDNLLFKITEVATGSATFILNAESQS